MWGYYGYPEYKINWDNFNWSQPTDEDLEEARYLDMPKIPVCGYGVCQNSAYYHLVDWEKIGGNIDIHDIRNYCDVHMHDHLIIVPSATFVEIKFGYS